MPKYEKGSQEAKDYMASLREKAKEKREALKNVKVENNNFSSSDSEQDVEIVTNSKEDIEQVQDVEEEKVTIKKPRKRQATKSKKKIIIEDESNTETETLKPKITRKPRESKKTNDIPSLIIDKNPLLSSKVIRFL